IKLLAISEEQLAALSRQATLCGLPIGGLVETVQEDTYYDTEDFRLFRAGLSLRNRAKAGHVTATLKEVLPAGDASLIRDRREMEERVEAPDPGEGPALGGLGERVSPLLGAKALVPILRLRTTRNKGLVGSAEGGSVELCFDRVEMLPGNGGEAVAHFLEIEAEDRGAAPGTLEAIGQELLTHHGLLPSTISKLERGLAALGILGDARGELRTFDLKVQPTDRLIDAAYRVFRKHFERMKANEPGTRLGEDPEFLHDMRVSTRRLRAAFRTFRGVFSPARLSRFNRDLKWIAAVLGDIRDLDVYLERLPEYSTSLPESEREALSRLTDHVAGLRDRARTRMLKALETRRYRAFLEAFERFLARGAPARPSLPDGRTLVTQAAPLRIRRALKKVLRAGRAIPEVDPPAQDLHRLRIICKRLRYTCEFFRDLYGKPMRRFIRSVVLLQDLLGAHQDACVAGETLRGFALALPSGRKEGVRTALALGQLVGAQDLAAADSRAGFREAWRTFDRKSVRRSMWGPQPV
ncbi:MAG: CYTH and CHAD domain-containing protein, partial [Planctomycetota bacterium]